MKPPIPSIVKALRKSIPGSIVECTWSRVTGRTYDPVAGAYVDTVTSVPFTGIRGNYRTFEKVGGILAEDFRLTMDFSAVPAKPVKDDEITVAGVVCGVVASEDFAGIAYELQMRRK